MDDDMQLQWIQGYKEIYEHFLKPRILIMSCAFPLNKKQKTKKKKRRHSVDKRKKKHFYSLKKK